MEKERLVQEFKESFESTLGDRRDLLHIFRAAWEGERRRQIAQVPGAVARRVKALGSQLRRRLVKFCAGVQGGLKEMLDGMKKRTGARCVCAEGSLPGEQAKANCPKDKTRRQRLHIGIVLKHSVRIWIG